MSQTREITVHSSRLDGAVTVPSSKSHTIRALLIAAGANGISHVENALDSADAESCISAIRTLGASVEETARTPTGMSLAISPPAGGVFSSPAGDLPLHIDVGNSGTTLYLLAALAALRGGETTFTGDQSIRKRDAQPLLQALRTLGARVTGGPCAPFTVKGPLRPGLSVEMECPTSQYLSALLLAAPLISAPPRDETILIPTVLYERPYVDMTCWWLDQQSITYSRKDYSRFAVAPGQQYRPVRARLPGDYSSATFWFAAAALTGGTVTVEGLAPDDVQGDRGVLDILSDLGARVTWRQDESGAPAVTVRGPLTRGGTFDLNAMPDALPALAAAGCYAPQPLILENVPQARAKETDRIAVMARELRALGADTEELPDGIVIRPSTLTGGTVESHGDHRVAMAAAVAALGASGPVRIRDAGAAAVTYPSFFADLHRLAPEALRTRHDGSEW
ncbi:MAG: 3-phosphoshikimate 1-carboxyvinyltransferase [Spirochaetaceae bacterium]|nr:MAG: 3-phosphoshikimate 1-carboxyvinyltransferase [Spirochaetaceae bacterium]